MVITVVVAMVMSMMAMVTMHAVFSVMLVVSVVSMLAIFSVMLVVAVRSMMTCGVFSLESLEFFLECLGLFNDRRILSNNLFVVVFKNAN